MNAKESVRHVKYVLFAGATLFGAIRGSQPVDAGIHNRVEQTIPVLLPTPENIYFPIIANQQVKTPPIPVKEPIDIRAATFNGHIENDLPVQPEVEKMLDDGVELFALQEVSPQEVGKLEENLGIVCDTGGGNVAICSSPESEVSFIGPVMRIPISNPTGSRDVVCSSVSKAAKKIMTFCGAHIFHEDQDAQFDQLKNNVDQVAAADPAQNEENKTLIVVAADFNSTPDVLTRMLGLSLSNIACKEPEKPCPGDVDVRGPVDNVVLFGNGTVIDGKRGQNTDVSDHTSVQATLVLYP